MKEACWKLAEWAFKGLMAVCVASLVVPALGLGLLLILSPFVLESAQGAEPKVGANNIYREGTRGHTLAAFAQTVLPPTVTPYFIMGQDKSFFYDQVDQSKRQAVLSASSMKALQEMSTAAPARASAFAKFELGLPEGANRTVCKVVFVDPDRAVVGSTLMHELMHCRIGSAELNSEYRDQLMKAIGFAESDLKPGAALSMFEEILARAMSLSYIVNYGVDQDGEFFKTRMTKPYPMNPGPFSMPRVLHICLKKGACSIEAGALAKTLLSDAKFTKLLREDFNHNYAHNLRVGFR